MNIRDLFVEVRDHLNSRLELLPNHLTATQPADRSENTVVQNRGRENLKKRLRDKIEKLRTESGSIKIKKKSYKEIKCEREAAKRRLKRIKLAKLKTENPKPEKSDEITSLAFSGVIGEETSKTNPKQKKGRRISQKFKNLSIARKWDQAKSDFVSSGRGGEKVVEKEWENALQRASGKKILDDPKKLQKSIDDTFKQKAKRAKKWQQRLQKQEEEREAREKKRKKNLQARSEQRTKKKISKKK